MALTNNGGDTCKVHAMVSSSRFGVSNIDASLIFELSDSDETANLMTRKLTKIELITL